MTVSVTESTLSEADQNTQKVKTNKRKTDETDYTYENCRRAVTFYSVHGVGVSVHIKRIPANT